MLALVALPAAQEDRRAIMRARQHERPGPGHQPSGGAAAEPVDEDDGIGCRRGRLELVDLGLDAVAQRGRLDVERGGQLPDGHLVRRACGEMLDGPEERCRR